MQLIPFLEPGFQLSASASRPAISTGHKHKQVAMFICIDNVSILNFKANDQRRRHSENTKQKHKPRSRTQNKLNIQMTVANWKWIFDLLLGHLLHLYIHKYLSGKHFDFLNLFRVLIICGFRQLSSIWNELVNYTILYTICRDRFGLLSSGLIRSKYMVMGRGVRIELLNYNYKFTATWTYLI